MNNNAHVLEELAKHFANDYFSISDVTIDENNDENTARIKMEIFGSHYESIDVRKSHRVRNIFVIGAGASFDCYPEIPMADTAIKKIRTKLDIDYLERNKWFKKKNDSYAEKLRKLGKYNPEDFESQLAIFSNFISIEDILTELKELYNKKWYPSLFYEMLAHLFKHRFIDVIINFNFDELLDQALREELGQADYKHIYSDGQCMPLQDVLTDGRLKQPIYIKPHGTISHKSSLKFTKEAYFKLSEDVMTNLLESLIKGERGENREPITRVNLIVVGTSMKSFEFNSIVKKLPKDSAIYFISPTPPDIEAFEKEDPDFARIFKGFYHSKEGGFDRYFHIDTSQGPNQLGKIFEGLYTHGFRKKFFTPLYEPKDIYRHKLINEVFYYDGKRLFKDDRNYLLVRTHLEFVIAISKAKGRISLNELMQERFGSYYREYYDLAAEQKAQAETIYDIFDYYGGNGELYDYSERKFDLPGRHDKSFIHAMLEKFISLAKSKSLEELHVFSGDRVKQAEKWLGKIYEHDSLSIAPKFNFNEFYTYQYPHEGNILPTKLSLIRKFISVIKKWDLVLISSSKGKILKNILQAEKKMNETASPPFNYSEKFCCLVLEDDLYRDELASLISPDRMIDNKIHMCSRDHEGDNIMLFLKRGDKQKPWKFVKAIIYHRIHNSLKIFPYFTESERDMEYLSRVFFKQFCFATEVQHSQAAQLEILNNFAKSFDKKMKDRKRGGSM